MSEAETIRRLLVEEVERLRHSLKEEREASALYLELLTEAKEHLGSSAPFTMTKKLAGWAPPQSEGPAEP